jgi:hemerythrin
MYFEWKEEYEMGVEVVDRQHKKLLSIGRKLMTLIRTTDIIENFEEIKLIMNELRLYTIEHFSREEQFMKENGYPDLTSHAMEHEFLRRKLKQIDKLGQPNHETIIKLVSFVSDWISQHILISDMKIRTHILQSKGTQSIGR